MKAVPHIEYDVDALGEQSIASHPVISARTRTPILDLLVLIIRRKWFVAAVTVAAMIFGAVLSSLMGPVYTATATIMPPQAPQSSLSSMLGQLGSLASIGGAGGLLKNPSDLYVAFLQSRTISDSVIQKFGLQKRWHAKTKVAARKILEGHAEFEAAKNGLIIISVKDHDPNLASDVANFFVEALYGMNSNLAISEAAQRRLFFEKQLGMEKDALASAEDDLKATQQKTGVLTLSGQTELAVRDIAQTRAEISSREVELQGLLSYAAEDNSEVQRVRRELGTLRSQLTQLEDRQRRAAPGDTAIAANQIPAESLEYVRKLRSVKYHDTLYELLSRQYEAARIDEAKSAPVLQVVDPALPPDQKSGPPRTLITLGFMVFGFLGGCAFVFVQGSLQQATNNPDIKLKFDELQRHLPWISRRRI